MPDRPVLLPAAGRPRRADQRPEADWAMALILLAWAEGHGSCRGLRPGPGGLLACSCSQLAFEIGGPHQAIGAAA